MSTTEVLTAVEFNARTDGIEVTTMQRGKGRHMRYGSLNQAPPALRGEALELVRRALQKAGYASLAELDDALTRDLVTPVEDDEAPDSTD